MGKHQEERTPVIVVKNVELFATILIRTKRYYRACIY